MKKLISSMLILAMLFCFVGCESSTQKNVATISETQARQIATKALTNKIANKYNSAEPLVDLSKTTFDVESIISSETHYCIEGKYYIHYRYKSGIFYSNNFTVRVSMVNGNASVTV